MAISQDPMVQRRKLRAELRRAREEAGLTQRDVAPAMDWSQSKLIRIETGAVGITVNDLKALLQLYRITDKRRVNDLVEMARAAREPAWWAAYRNQITPEFRTFLGYESAALIIRNFQPVLIPGLLQTDEYARATITALAPVVAQPEEAIRDRVDLLVDLRMERQERLLQRSKPPKLFFGIDESAIHRWVGGPDVMRRQLLRLRKTLVDPDVTIWIVPYTAGLYQRQRSSYVLFELTVEEDESVLYLEGPRGDTALRDEAEETAIYLEAFWRLEQLALKNEDALDLVDEAIARVSNNDEDRPADPRTQAGRGTGEAPENQSRS